MTGGGQLPEPMRGYVLAALIEPPKLKAGWKRETNYFRDIAITILVQEVRDGFDLKATGGTSKRSSACGIVADTLGMTYDSVRKVWDRLGKHL